MSNEYRRPPVKVALMGLGRAMFEDHYPVYKAHPALFKIVAACDIHKERRDIIAKDFPDCKMFRRFEDMLDEKDIDIVDIATCTVDHVKHALMSLDKGLWTLLETPMALTLEDAQLLRGAAAKAKNRLVVAQRGFFSPEFQLAKMAMSDSRLGEIFKITVRKEDYVRRDDWQCVRRLGGGATYYAMTDLLIQALNLLPFPPSQMWSELKRIASMGDAEDYVHVNLKTRGNVSAEIEFNGGILRPCKVPSIEILAEKGTFTAMAGEATALLTVISPKHTLPRRRSSVRTPALKDMHEDLCVEKIPLELPRGTMHGPSAFWKHLYDSVRTAAPFPMQLEYSIEAVKFAQIIKKNSPFAK